MISKIVFVLIHYTLVYRGVIAYKFSLNDNCLYHARLSAAKIMHTSLSGLNHANRLEFSFQIHVLESAVASHLCIECLNVWRPIQTVKQILGVLRQQRLKASKTFRL